MPNMRNPLTRHTRREQRNEQTKPMKEIEQQIITTASQFIHDLLGAHWGEIKTLINEAPDSQVSIGATIKINWQEAGPNVKTTISFAKRVTDECEVELNDPNQIQLPIPDPLNASQDPGAEEPPHIESGTGEEVPAARKPRRRKTVEAA